MNYLRAKTDKKLKKTKSISCIFVILSNVPFLSLLILFSKPPAHFHPSNCFLSACKKKSFPLTNFAKIAFF